MARPLYTEQLIEAQLFDGDTALWTSPEGFVTVIRNLIMTFAGGDGVNVSLQADTDINSAWLLLIPAFYTGTILRETRQVLPPGEAITFTFHSDGVLGSCSLSVAGYVLSTP